jgi:hypothetical protein
MHIIVGMQIVQSKYCKYNLLPLAKRQLTADLGTTTQLKTENKLIEKCI